MDDGHRKVELQSPEDLRYLIDNVTRVARERIDLHLPPSAAQVEDALRRRVEELVQEYINSVFSMAAPSLNVNGLEHAALSSFLQREAVDLEPYDRRLHEQIQGMYESLEKETLELSKMRREAGQSAAQNFKDEWERDLESIEAVAALKDADGSVAAGIEGEDAVAVAAASTSLTATATATDPATGVTLGLSRLERQESIERDFQRGLDNLNALKKTLPATTAKLERAAEGVAYAESKLS